MNTRFHAVVVAGALLVFLVLSCATALADYYDNFDDGQYCQDPNDPDLFDPNQWDIDNPHWTIEEVLGDTFLADASDGWLRLYASSAWDMYMFIAAGAHDEDLDPNTSATYFDDSAPHYVMARVKVSDPNTGESMLFIHGDPVTWTTYCASLEHDDNAFRCVWLNGLDRIRLGRVDLPHLDETNGFWVVAQLDADGDPNHSYFRMAAWNGGKYDWDGVWRPDKHILTTWDPNTYEYWGEGLSGVAEMQGPQAGDGDAADAKFDNVEIRWGTFTNTYRTLTIKMKDCCDLNIEPDILADSNNIDPNNYNPVVDPDNLRRYTNGTAVVLDAVVPCGNKSFKKWTVKGPNDSGDPLYQIVVDTNEVVYLTMDGDYLVKATCKCGGGGMAPPMLSLLTLGALALLRRWRVGGM